MGSLHPVSLQIKQPSHLMELQEYYREHSLSGIDFSLKDKELLDSSRHHQFAKLYLFFILYFCLDGRMDFCLWFEKHLIFPV